MESSTETGRHIFFLIRHGETRGNTTKLILPQNEEVLTETGITQTKILGDALKDVHFTKAYCSPFVRAVHTTEIILKQNESSKDLPYKTDERIREIGVGGFEGFSPGLGLKEVSSHLQKGLPLSQFTSRGSETYEAMRIRGQSFMEDLLKDLNEDDKPETVLIVSHAVFISSFMGFINVWDKVNLVNWDDSCEKLMKNTTYMKFSISQLSDGNSKRELLFEKIHENSHLKESAAVASDSLTKLAKTKDCDGLSGCFQV